MIAWLMRGVLGSHLIFGKVGGVGVVCEGEGGSGARPLEEVVCKTFASLKASRLPLELPFAQTSPALPGPGLYLMEGMGTVAA